MTTQEAVLDAMTRGKVKKQYNPETFRKMRQRVKKNEMSIGWMIDFLLKHKYTIRHEFNWSKPRAKKGEQEESPKAVKQHAEKPAWVQHGKGVDPSLLNDKFMVNIQHDKQAIENHAAKHYLGLSVDIEKPAPTILRKMTAEEIKSAQSFECANNFGPSTGQGHVRTGPQELQDASKCLSCGHTREECQCSEFNYLGPLVL